MAATNQHIINILEKTIMPVLNKLAGDVETLKLEAVKRNGRIGQNEDSIETITGIVFRHQNDVTILKEHDKAHYNNWTKISSITSSLINLFLGTALLWFLSQNP